MQAEHNDGDEQEPGPSYPNKRTPNVDHQKHVLDFTVNSGKKNYIVCVFCS